MSWERAIGKLAQRVVNNFAANRAATVSDWRLVFISGIGSSGFPAPAGQVC
jgi:D-arabinose 5-phosphate isomerase GutQ